MLNRCAIEFFVKHIQCSFLLFSIHFEARQFGTLEYYFFRYKEMETFSEGKKGESYNPLKVIFLL